MKSKIIRTLRGLADAIVTNSLDIDALALMTAEEAPRAKAAG